MSLRNLLPISFHVDPWGDDLNSHMCYFQGVSTTKERENLDHPQYGFIECVDPFMGGKLPIDSVEVKGPDVG